MFFSHGVDFYLLNVVLRKLKIKIEMKHFKTVLSDKYPNIDPITEDIINKEFLNDVDKFSKSLLLKNIYALYTSFLQNDKINYRIYDEQIDRRNIIGGIVEAAFYLTHSFDIDHSKQSYKKTNNIIKVLNCIGGYFNAVFVVSIYPKKNKKNTSDFALRILFDDKLDSNKYSKLLKKLMKNKNYEKYFVKPIVINKNIEHINETKQFYNVNTYWQLLPRLYEILPNDTKENIIRYLKTIFNCLKIIHNNGMLYRDFKPQNFMFDGENILLSDIDFTDTSDEIIECYNIDGLFDYMKRFYSGEKYDIAMDNVTGLIAFLYEYIYFKSDGHEIIDIDTKSQISHEFTKLIKKMHKSKCLIDSKKFLSYILNNFSEIKFEKLIPTY